MANRTRMIPALACLLALTACAKAGPEYRRPEMAIPERFGAAGDWQPAQPASPDAAWWRVMADPELDRLEEMVTIGNADIQVAEAQYRSARAVMESATQAMLPTLGLSATESRAATGKAYTTRYGVAGSASWEVDLWGRLRRGVEGAEAKFAASGEDLASARLSAQALLAQVYWQLRAADRHLELLRKAIGESGRFLRLTETRHEAGVAARLDVEQARTQLQNLRAQAIEVDLQRARLEHHLAMLTGKTTLQVAPWPEGKALPAVPRAPNLIPSRVLESRPDIAAAERRVAVANAQIGVARVAFFPALNLGAEGGYKGGVLEQLIRLPNRYWSLGPSLAFSLLDSGQRKAALAQARAGLEQAEAQYRQVVLTAFQEVEDDLATARLLEREAEEQHAALEAARRSREIAEHQYGAGTASSLNVIVARTTEIAAERGAVDLHQRRVLAVLQLLKNCAGRFSDAPRDPAQDISEKPPAMNRP
ncbi:MAG: efflux transporter outer membrane subunit [Magnetococcales bacterium]|nr:efflux transporter outer membrane subunit [Magnetococcales bacterium]